MLDVVQIEKQRVPPASASNDEKRRAQRERSRSFGVEALENKGENLSFPSGSPTTLVDYGDPVNLKFPLKPDNRARNARARFKQFADTYSRTSSKRVVHTRIVRRLLSIGANPSLNEDDPLDKLLPKSLRDRMSKRSKKAMTTPAKIPVEKNIKLQDGEELMDFVNKVFDAVGQHRQKTERSLFLRGIFKGFIIMRDFESGKLFQSKLSRDNSGLIKLGDAVEVRQTFTPVSASVSKSDDSEDTFKAVELPPTTVLLKDGKLTSESIEALEGICKSANGEVPDFDFVEVAKSKAQLWDGIV